MPSAAWLLALTINPCLMLAAGDLDEQLLAATRKGDLAAVRQLLDAGAAVDAKTRYGSTPLFFACDRGHLEIARLLIQRGANVNVRDNFYSASALTWAMDKKHDGIVELLMEHGADVSGALRGSIQSGGDKMFELILAKGKLSPSLLDEAFTIAELEHRGEMAKALAAKGGRRLDFPVDDAVMKSYAGKYLDGESSVELIAANGKLSLMQQGSPVTLTSIARDRFRLLQAGMDVTFERDASGTVIAVSYSPRGGTVRLKKVQP